MYRPVWAEVDLDRIARNVEGLADLAAPAELMAVVKADGYGHGADAVARIALSTGATRLAVASPEEGIALRRGGVGAPILVLGALLPGQAELFRQYNLTATLASDAPLRELGAVGATGARPLRLHLKIDTGMGRLGFFPEQTEPLVAKLRGMHGVELEGIYSHLACADQEDQSSVTEQLERFRIALRSCEEVGGRPRLVHIANTAGLLRGIGTAECNLVRVGLGIYGIYPYLPSPDLPELRPAMAIKSRVVSVKRVPAAFGVSYGHTYTTSRETTLCTVPMGYADGLRRGLSGKVRVLIGGKVHPVVGRICMDQCIVDVGDSDVAVGDEVVLLGEQSGESVAVEEWAEHLGTISYELLCGISARVPRRYVEGRLVRDKLI